MKSTPPPTIGAESVALWLIVSYYGDDGCLIKTNTNIIWFVCLLYRLCDDPLAVRGASKVVAD